MTVLQVALLLALASVMREKRHWFVQLQKREQISSQKLSKQNIHIMCPQRNTRSLISGNRGCVSNRSVFHNEDSCYTLTEVTTDFSAFGVFFGLMYLFSDFTCCHVIYLTIFTIVTA